MKTKSTPDNHTCDRCGSELVKYWVKNVENNVTEWVVLHKCMGCGALYAMPEGEKQ